MSIFVFFKSVHNGLLFLVFFSWQGLTLFNFDMIRKGGSGNCYYVIDINYFPGMQPLTQQRIHEQQCQQPMSFKQKHGDVDNITSLTLHALCCGLMNLATIMMRSDPKVLQFKGSRFAYTRGGCGCGIVSSFLFSWKGLVHANHNQNFPLPNLTT